MLRCRAGRRSVSGGDRVVIVAHVGGAAATSIRRPEPARRCAAGGRPRTARTEPATAAFSDSTRPSIGMRHQAVAARRRRRRAGRGPRCRPGSPPRRPSGTSSGGRRRWRRRCPPARHPARASRAASDPRSAAVGHGQSEQRTRRSPAPSWGCTGRRELPTSTAPAHPRPRRRAPACRRCRGRPRRPARGADRPWPVAAATTSAEPRRSRCPTTATTDCGVPRSSTLASAPGRDLTDPHAGRRAAASTASRTTGRSASAST